jgi:fructose-1-phosphate kinase PfkB-like protein
MEKDMSMIRTVCLNPALDKTALIAGFQIDHVNRIVSLRRDAGSGKGINVSKVVAKLGGKTCAYALLGGTVGTQIESDIVDMGIKLRLCRDRGAIRGRTSRSSTPRPAPIPTSTSPVLSWTPRSSSTFCSA